MKRSMFRRTVKCLTAGVLTAAMAVTALAALPAAETPAASIIYYGDVDQNGVVEATDALAVLQHVVKLQMITDETSLEIADADGDGAISASDALVILQTVVKLVEAKPYIADPSTPVPTEEPTDTPAPTDTPEPTDTPAPTESVEPTAKPLPDYYIPYTIPAVEPGEAYAGTSAAVLETNGAEVDENGIITFTDENAANEKGVQFVNPLAGRTDLRVSVEEALAGQPDMAKDISAEDQKIYNPAVTYPRPVWTNGVSISFWVKSTWTDSRRPNAYPLLVMTQNEDYPSADGRGVDEKSEKNFSLMVKLNGTVRFESGNTPQNSFRADSYLAGVNEQWNYYTVTFANDWITVYVNGQENVYSEVLLTKDEGLKYFNDGFMTRYNTVGAPTEEDAASDIRGYLTRHHSSSEALMRNSAVGNLEAGLIGNSRYDNPDVTHGKSPLLVDYITDEHTQLWLGGTTTKRLKTPAQGLGPATYSVKTGTQVADVQTYDVELTAEQVAANYAQATRPDGTKVTPDQTEAPAE